MELCADLTQQSLMCVGHKWRAAVPVRNRDNEKPLG